MRVQRQHQGVTTTQIAVHPLDGIGIHVGGSHLDRGRQVDDRLAIGSWLPDIEDGVADLHGELEFGSGVRLGGVLVVHLGSAQILGVLGAQSRALGGDVLDAVAVEPEDHAPLQGGRGVVQMHDGLWSTRDRFVGAFDQMLASLGQHLDGHVIGNEVGFDQLPHEIEIGLAGRREADLDLLVSHGDEQREHTQFARWGHGVDQGLITVT